MGFWQNLFRASKPARQLAAPAIRARFDAAESLDDRRHWANSDWLSLDGALTPVVRRTLRNRARYERLNNSYLAGICETLSFDLIGTGPRLQLNAGDQAADRVIEKAFYDWSWYIDLPCKMRTMRQSKLIDGEAFAMLFTNPKLEGVQLDLRLIEAEMIATPIGLYVPITTPEGSIVDGLEFDDVGNVAAYKVLKYHPGSNYYVNNFQFTRVPADNIIHWFTRMRPAQHRGVSEVAPALRLFAQLRRYTDAVIAAAETAADFAAFLHTNSPAAEVDDVDAFAEMPIEKRSLVTLPEGWDVSQLKAEQPTANFGEFRRNILNEIARCLQIPYNIAALDSSSYNYASGRMDHQIYSSTQRVLRDELERLMLDKLFRAWADEAVLLGMIPRGLPPISEWQWQWVWDGKEHVDPSKEASAAQIRLETHTTTLAHEYAKQGKNWEAELRQRAAEISLMKDLGLFIDLEPQATYPAATPEEADQQAQAADGYIAPKAAQEEARRGLKWRAEYGRGGTQVGVARARDISGGRALSLETIGRMVSFFARHERDQAAEGYRPGEKGYPSAGRIAAALWGGEPGRRWAEGIWARETEDSNA